MTSTGTSAATAGKKKALRKTVADKDAANPASIVDEKIGTPARKRTLSKRMVTPTIQPEERHHLIEVAAYYVAERRGFHGSCSHDDWLQAEREIDAMIAAGKFLD